MRRLASGVGAAALVLGMLAQAPASAFESESSIIDVGGLPDLCDVEDVRAQLQARATSEEEPSPTSSPDASVSSTDVPSPSSSGSSSAGQDQSASPTAQVASPSASADPGAELESSDLRSGEDDRVGVEPTSAAEPLAPESVDPMEISTAEPSVTVEPTSTASPSASAESESPVEPVALCPVPVAGVQAAAGVNEVRVSWSVGGVPTIDESGVQPYTDADRFIVRVSGPETDRLVEVDEPSAVVSGLRNGVEYGFEVFAVTEGGRSAGSGKVLATPSTGMEGVVAGLIVEFEPESQPAPGQQDVPGEARVEEVDLTVAERVGDDAVLVDLSQPVSLEQAEQIAAELAADPAVAWAEPDEFFFTSSTSTPVEAWNLTGQYGVDAVSDPTAGSGATVAVIDTGSTAHPDLDARLVEGYDFVSNPEQLMASRQPNAPPVAFDGDYVDESRYGALGRDANPTDPGDWRDVTPTRVSSWHGTGIAGVISSVVPGASIQPVRALSWRGGLLSDIAAGITWASGGSVDGVPANQKPSKVINMSFAVETMCPVALQDAIDAARDRGSILIAAAGNAGDDAAKYAPGNCSGVITVGATNADGTRADYSNYGPVVDLAAPGGDATSPVTTLSNPGTSAAYGTSVAAAHVSAGAAMLAGADPDLTPDDAYRTLTGSDYVKDFATGTCDANPDYSCGAGILSLAQIATISSGDQDYALTLNGSTQSAVAPDNTAFDLATAFSVEFWVKPSTTCSSRGSVVRKSGSYAFVCSGGTWRYGLATSSAYTEIDTRIPVRSGAWQHLAFTRASGVNTVKVYSDGQLAYSGAAGAVGTGAIYNSTTELEIGKETSSSYFAGTVDEVRLFTTERSASEVATDMHTYGPTDTAGLTAYYDFNEGPAGTTGTGTVYNRDSGAATATNLRTISGPTYTDVKQVTSNGGNTVVTFPRSYLTAAGGWRSPEGVTSMTHLVVAGGASGTRGATGSYYGSGGGGGGVGSGTTSLAPGSIVGVTVGQGGNGNANATGSPVVPGNAGQSSLFSPTGGTVVTSTGGQPGPNNNNGGASGSGVQSGVTRSYAGGVGTGQGGGGGGGAGGSGSGLNGGIGFSSSITGTAVLYGSGGAGYNGSFGTAASGGGIGTVGMANTGGGGSDGGGAGGFTGGGSGVVIVSYSTAATFGTEDLAMSFTHSSGQYAEAGSSVLDATGDFTVEAWTYDSELNSGWQYIASKGGLNGQTGNNQKPFYLGTKAGSQEFSVSGWEPGVVLPLNQWVHVAVTKTGSTAKLYVNGQLAAETTSYNPSWSFVFGTFSYNFRVGQFMDSRDEEWQGRLDEVRVWSDVRTAAEIQDDMDTYGPVTASNLTAYYDFNEGPAGSTGTGTVINRAAGAASTTNLTTVNSPTYVDVKSEATSGANTIVTFPRTYLTAAGGWQVPEGVTGASALIVGGGGGGGFDGGGGGGGGGVKQYTSDAPVTAGSVATVVVGQGGRGAHGYVNGSSCTDAGGSPFLGCSGGTGGDSTLGSVTVVGGGGGGGANASGGSSSLTNALGGGGGGGGHQQSGTAVNAGGSGQSNGGSVAANASNDVGAGGGGGRTGAQGSDGGSTALSGAGGTGTNSSLSGSTLMYGGGGGGGTFTGLATATAVSGAGKGGNSGAVATSGDVNRGGGGGGGGVAFGGMGDIAGNGGSGVIIVSYATASVDAACTPAETQYTSGATTYRVVAFKDTGSCTWTVPSGVSSVDYLVVGGGGGGGARHGGGGGAGGMLDDLAKGVTPGLDMTVTVGGGGAGAPGSSPASSGSLGSPGGNSVISGGGLSASVIAIGGGYGAWGVGGNGGSGGGGGGPSSGGSGTAGQGSNGGTGAGPGCGSGSYCGGGGGGAGGAGETANTGSASGRAGNGGAGDTVSWISSTVASQLGIGATSLGSAYFAGGGGGGVGSGGTAGSGGSGGGAAGSVGYAAGENAQANTGGGGGGSGVSDAGQQPGGSGGSGVVVLRYVQPSGTLCTPLTYPSGSYTVVEFQGTGSCSWTVPTGVTSVEVLAVGGGGGGGGGSQSSDEASATAGGGGGGGRATYSSSLAVSGAVSVTVGAGGSGGAAATTGSFNATSGAAGGTSSFGSVSASGGGGGGVGTVKAQLTESGAGGASGRTVAAVTTATAGGSPAWDAAGGGAGSAENGSDGTDIAGLGATGGDGGSGYSSSITGAAIVYGGGGGGGGTWDGSGSTGADGTGGSGGVGGGGAGSQLPGTAAVAGTSGLGGGGGGGGRTNGSASVAGARGGDGVVIVRYQNAPDAPTSVTGTASDSGQVTVSWTAPTYVGVGSITGYTVTQASGGTYSAVAAGTCQSSAPTSTSTSCTVTGLTPGTTYTFKVAARATSGSTTYTSIDSAASSGVTVYGTLSQFAVTATDGSALGTQTAGTSFSVKVTAQDSGGRTVTSFTGTVSISSSNTTITSGSGVTPSFTAGVLASRSVTVTTAGASRTLTATVTAGSTSGTSAGFTVNPAAASLADSTVTAATSPIAINGGTSDITVQLKDQYGNNLTSNPGTVVVASTLGTLANSGTATYTSNGAYTVTLTSGTVSGTSAVTATLNTGSGAQALTSSASVVVDPGAASKLVVSSIGAQIAGTAFPVTVTLTDTYGNAVNNTGATGTVTLSVASGTGTLGGTVSGTIGVGSSAVTITGVTYSKAETGVSLTATGAGAGSTVLSKTGTSATFAVTAGAASLTTSTIAASPSSISADGASTSTITVTLKDANGNALTASGGTVAISTNLGSVGATTNNNNGTYTATLTAGLTAGTATVSATLNSGSGANALTNTASVTLVAQDPTQVLITTQPTAGVSGASLSQQPVVRLADASGNTVAADSTTQVTVRASAGTLGGTTTVTAVNGVVTFTNLTFAGLVGTNYQLIFESGSLTSATSNNISPSGVGTASTLSITTPAGDTTYGTDFSPQPVVTVKDSGGNTVTSYATAVTATVKNASGATLETGTATPSSGVATFSGLGSDATAGTITVEYSSGALTGASETVTVSKASQTITFTQPGAVTYGAAPYQLSPTSTSGLAVTLASNTSSICTVSANIVTIVGAGTCSLTATQAGNANYDPATSVTQTFTVNQATQAAVSVTSAASILYGQDYTVTAAGGSGTGALTFLPGTTFPGTAGCSVTTGTGALSYTSAGTCEVKAQRAGDANYLVRTSSDFTLTIAKAGQTLAFTSNVPSTPVSGDTYTPTAEAVSTVTGMSSSIAPTFTIAPASAAVCSISAGVVTFLTSGSCVIRADAASSTNFEAAAQITQTVVVGSINQNITFDQPTSRTYGSASFALDATSSSGLTVTYALGVGTTSGTCTVSTLGVVTITDVGTCEVIASQAGDAQYAPASSVARAFQVTAALPSAPTLSSASASSQSITVGFTAPGFTGAPSVSISGYRVVATPVVSGGAPIVTSTSCTTSPCTITGLVNGVAYTVTVAAINTAGTGAASSPSTALTPATAAFAVGNLAAIPGDTIVTLTWTALTNAQLGGGTFTRYVISMRAAGTSTWSVVSTALTSQSADNITIPGLDNGTSYDFQVVAITSANATEIPGNTAEVVQYPSSVPSAPQSPTVLAATATDVQFSWSAPQSNGGAVLTNPNYTVTVTASAGANAVTCTPAGTPTGSDRFCTASNLTNGAVYTFSVVATNRMGNSVAATTTYNVPSSDATLSNLVVMSPIEAVALTPAFASATTAYTASVANSVSSVTVTPTTTTAGATVTVDALSVTSGAASAPISLAVGTTVIEVEVTASDPRYSQTYTITITRATASSGGGAGSPDPQDQARVPINPPSSVTSGTQPGVVLVDGVVMTDVVLTPNSTDTGWNATGADFSLSVQTRSATGSPEPLAPGGAMQVPQGGEVVVNGDGYLPGSDVNVFAIPRGAAASGASSIDRGTWRMTARSAAAGTVYLGSTAANGGGVVSATFAVPGSIGLGGYVLQVNGVTETDQVRSVNLLMDVIAGAPSMRTGMLREAAFFEGASADFSSHGRAKLRAMVADIPAGAESMQISVVGVSTALETPRANLRLARDRAERIVAFLEGAGVKGTVTISLSTTYELRASDGLEKPLATPESPMTSSTGKPLTTVAIAYTAPAAT